MKLYTHPSLVAAYEYEWGNSERIFPALIEYNMAYLISLADTGYAPKPSLIEILNTLQKLQNEGYQSIEYRSERDGLQPNIEVEVQRQTSKEVGGWLSVGRARQECELVARQIVERDAFLETIQLTRTLVSELLALARRYVHSVMPFHTWAQHAEPISFSYYLVATARAILDDLSRMEHAFSQLNRSRAGIGQIVPSPTPVNRRDLAVMLGFDGILPNSLHAYSSLDIELSVLSSLSLFTSNLARFTETLFLWTSSDFQFMKFGEEFTGTSYAMPHKRNPYALRLARPAASRVAGAFTEATQLFSGSLQIVGNGVIHIPNRTISAIDIVNDLCTVLSHSLPTITIDEQRMAAATKSGMCNAPQLLFFLVEHHGVSYRLAHEICGTIVTHAMESGYALTNLPSEDFSVLLNKLTNENIDIDVTALRAALDPGNIIATRTDGGPAPESVLAECDDIDKSICQLDSRVKALISRRGNGKSQITKFMKSCL